MRIMINIYIIFIRKAYMHDANLVKCGGDMVYSCILYKHVCDMAVANANMDVVLPILLFI